MHSDLVKASAIVLLSFGCWILPLTLKFSKLEQGISLVAALYFSLELIRYSKEMEEKESVIRAERAMQRQLIETEITLETFQREMQLADQYRASEKIANEGEEPAKRVLPSTQQVPRLDTHPEITPEFRETLESLWSLDGNGNGNFPESPEYIEVELAETETETETEKELKSLYLQCRNALKEGKNVTWVIHNILKMKGRKYQDGKDKLTLLLELGKQKEWSSSDN